MSVFNKTVRREAIEFVEQCRTTHVAWIDYLLSETAQNMPAPTIGDCGDVEHHERCIAGYDDVLAQLRRRRLRFVWLVIALLRTRWQRWQQARQHPVLIPGTGRIRVLP